MGTSAGTARPALFQISKGSIGNKGDAIRVAIVERAATPTSFIMSKTSIQDEAEDTEFAVTEGTTTPRSFQTSEGLFVEKATAAEHTFYLKGWRLHFLSLRSASLDHNATSLTTLQRGPSVFPCQYRSLNRWDVPDIDH